MGWPKGKPTWRAGKREKGQTCIKCGSYGYDRTAPLCAECQRTATNDELAGYGIMRRAVVWTPTEVEYLKSHYPSEGSVCVAEALGKTPRQVLDKANKLHICLDKDAAHRIVHAKAQEYMTAHNPMKSEATQEKIKEWRRQNPDKVAAIQEKLDEGSRRLQKDKPTKLEKRLHACLDAIGVDYQPYAFIKAKFIVDVRIGRLIIETDGDYWHGHPSMVPLTERQVKQQKRDAARNKYLTKCGYTVVRIWERDLSLDLVRRILTDHRVLLPLWTNGIPADTDNLTDIACAR